MSANAKLRQSCPNQACKRHGTIDGDNVVRHSYLKVRCGRRRRYRCKACGKTFSRNTNTPYHRLRASRNLFDRVAHLSVEGVSISAIARICGRSWTTVFIRPHGAWRFGSELRTPAMQPGLASRALSFREIFLSEMPSAPSRMTTLGLPGRTGLCWSWLE